MVATRKDAMSNRFTRYVERLVHADDNRLLKPFRGHLRHPSLWKPTRQSVARGVAIGLFFGILTPVAQIVFSLLAAVVLRANIVVAAGSTLVTNPFTFPLVYYSAFRIGSFLTGRTASVPSQAAAEHAPDVAVSTEAAEHALDVGDWFTTLLDWLSNVGPPLLLGVVVLALAASLAGYVLVTLTWIAAAHVSRLLRPTKTSARRDSASL